VTERVKRNVDDVDYAALEGPRPMREVLHARARSHNAQDKATREQAFRARAREIGMLQSCLCCVPLVKYDTPSGHDDTFCPAHALWMSYEEVRKLYGDNA
jgi:hypothetical protein